MKMREMELELLVILDLMPPVPTPCTPRALFWPVHLGLAGHFWSQDHLIWKERLLGKIRILSKSKHIFESRVE